MSKMLDVLEAFLNLHGHTYMRLDGSTKPEARQVMMQRFNTDPRHFVFILSTRSGGVGINLTGADTVIFYDRCVRVWGAFLVCVALSFGPPLCLLCFLCVCACPQPIPPLRR
jgi:hypothetical protein